MGAHPKYLPPHVQLLRLAQDARERGLTFDEFWREAAREGEPVICTNDPDPPPGCVLWQTDARDRRTSREAIFATRAAWRRAYEGLPQTRSEHAVELLGEFLPDMEELNSEDEPAVGLVG